MVAELYLTRASPSNNNTHTQQKKEGLIPGNRRTLDKRAGTEYNTPYRINKAYTQTIEWQHRHRQHMVET